MIIKLAALGTLGYVGFKFLRSVGQAQASQAGRPSDLRMAGGPLSSAATVQHSADVPPAEPPAM